MLLVFLLNLKLSKSLLILYYYLWEIVAGILLVIKRKKLMKNFSLSSLPRSSNSPTSFTSHAVALISALDIFLPLLSTPTRKPLHSFAHLFIIPQTRIHKVLWARHLQRPWGFGAERDKPSPWHHGAYSLIEGTDPKQENKLWQRVIIVIRKTNEKLRGK